MLTNSKIAEALRWISSVASALLVAYVATVWTLNDRIDEGQAVFDSISIRYFAAVFALYEKSDDGSAPRLTEDEQVKVAYREIVGDIREDIRWLRTNPLYGQLIERNAGLVFLQNLLTAEQVSGGEGVNRNTLHFMCKAYGKSSWQHDGGDDVLSDLRKLAVRLCT